AHGQRDPLNEYKREAFEMFEAMLTRVRESVTIVLAHIEVRLGPPPEEQAPPPPPPPQPRVREVRPSPALALAGAGEAFAPPAKEDWGKVPRNAPCPCGSGKKYKYCHGRV